MGKTWKENWGEMEDKQKKTQELVEGLERKLVLSEAIEELDDKDALVRKNALESLTRLKLFDQRIVTGLVATLRVR